MRLLLVFALLAVLPLAATSASAANRRKVTSPVGPHQVQQKPNKQAIMGAQGRAAYPRYYWGIPAREFQNLGTPHGDQGIRGDGIQWQPW